MQCDISSLEVMCGWENVRGLVQVDANKMSVTINEISRQGTHSRSGNHCPKSKYPKRCNHQNSINATMNTKGEKRHMK